MVGLYWENEPTSNPFREGAFLWQRRPYQVPLPQDGGLAMNNPKDRNPQQSQQDRDQQQRERQQREQQQRQKQQPNQQPGQKPGEQQQRDE